MRSDSGAWAGRSSAREGAGRRSGPGAQPPVWTEWTGERVSPGGTTGPRVEGGTAVIIGPRPPGGPVDPDTSGTDGDVSASSPSPESVPATATTTTETLSRPPRSEGRVQQGPGPPLHGARRGQDVAHLSVRHLVEQPVGGHQEAVADPHVDGADRGLDDVMDAQRPGDDVAVRVPPGLLLGELAGPDELAHDGVVLAELAQVPPAQAVHPAVPQVEHQQSGPGDPGDAGHRGAHPRNPAVGARPPPDLRVGAPSAANRTPSGSSTWWRSRRSARRATAIALATAPPAWPPMPSATANTSGPASSASSLWSRTRPWWVAEPHRTSITMSRPLGEQIEADRTGRPSPQRGYTQGTEGGGVPHSWRCEPGKEVVPLSPGRATLFRSSCGAGRQPIPIARRARHGGGGGVRRDPAHPRRPFRAPRPGDRPRPHQRLPDVPARLGPCPVRVHVLARRPRPAVPPGEANRRGRRDRHRRAPRLCRGAAPAAGRPQRDGAAGRVADHLEHGRSVPSGHGLPRLGAGGAG